MIAADTSSLLNYLKQAPTGDVPLVKRALESHQLTLPPVVLAELLSSPKMTAPIKAYLVELPQLELKVGFWIRTGEHRAELLKKGLKARLADSLIATFCLDHQLPLITADEDFRHFAQHFNLKLLTG